MATDLERLVVQLSADIKGFEREMAKARGVTHRQAKAIEDRWRQANQRLDGIGRGMVRSLTGALAGIGAALGVRELIRLTDTWTDLSSRVNIAAGSMEAGEAVMARIPEMARRTYSSIEQTTESYLSNSTALRELGYSTDQTLDYVEALNNALTVAGAKGDRAASVSSALAKAMAGGSLSGQNLNTVIETGGRVAEALAEGLGVSVGELRRLGAQGRITGRDIVTALSSQLERLRREAASMPATISDGLQLLNNALLQYVGNGDSATATSARIAEALTIIADNFDTAADAGLKLAAVLAGALLGRSIAGLIGRLGLGTVALTSFVRALAAARTMGGLATVMGGVGAAAGPMGVLVGGAVVASIVAYTGSSREATAASKGWAAALAAVKDAAEEVPPAVDKIAESNDRAAKRIEDSLKVGAEEIRKLEGAVAGYLHQLDAATMREAISEEQIGQVRSVVAQFLNGRKSAAELSAAIDAMALPRADLLEYFKELAERIEASRKATAALNKERAAIGQADEAGESRADQLRREGAEEYIQAQRDRNALTQKQLDLENEIARVRANSLKEGKSLTDEQVKQLAQENLAANARRAAEGRATKQGDRDAEAYRRAAEQIGERTQALLAETAAQAGINPLINDYGYAIEKAKAQHHLLTAATKAGIKDTPELRQKIGELANAYALATAESAKLAESQEKVRQNSDEMRALGRDVMSGFISDMRNGVSASEALGNALNKVSDKLLDIAMNSLFDSKGPLGSLFGAGGFGSLFGGARAAGGPVAPNRAYLVGERGPEMIVPKTAGMVIPNHALAQRVSQPVPRGVMKNGKEGGAAPQITYAPQIDARGADVAAVARLEQVIAKDRAEFTARVKQIVASRPNQRW